MYTYEMARALSTLPSLQVHLSLSRQSELLKESQELGLPGWPVDTYTGPMDALRASLRLPRLRRKFSAYLDRERFDWVCCTMTHLWNPFMLKGVRQSGARYLLVLHDARHHPGERYPLLGRMLKSEVNRADLVVTLSEYVRSQAIETFKLQPANVCVIPHGPFFYGRPRTPASAPPAKMPMRLLFFGRILPYKGLDLLVEAMRLLKRDFPEVKLIVAGQGNLGEGNRKALAELGAKVVNRWLASEEVSAIIAEGDLLVAPYTSASQSGVLPLAYAHALPVVATEVGGLREQVLPGVTGLLSGPPDPASLARTIARVISDPALYARLSAGASEYAAQSIAWPGLARQLASAMEQTGKRMSSPHRLRPVPA
ncbi:glycosyltransferase family 4 protein [Desulfoferula mesophila]